MTWCTDPDKAFDLKCDHIKSEEWCDSKDNSTCVLNRKETDMSDKSKFVLIKNVMTINELETSDVVIQITPDNKGFYVLKHRHMLDSQGQKYHISQLQNILLAKN